MTRRASELVDESFPRQWSRTVVTVSVHCRQCGYDLRGLRADGLCPECGFENWRSIQATVDPAASRLPMLRNPVAVGNGIFVLAACLLLGTLVLVSRPVIVQLQAWNRGRELPLLSWISQNSAMWLAILAFLACWSIWLIAPPRGREPGGAVWRDVGMLAVGTVGAAFAGALWMQSLISAQRLGLHMATALAAAIGLLGLRGVLNVIGNRSRVYRMSTGGRQSVELVIAALAVGIAGNVVQFFSDEGRIPAEWRVLGAVVSSISAFMLIIGLGYLAVNAWWIRSALRKPPPSYDQILLPVMPNDTSIPDREE